MTTTIKLNRSAAESARVYAEALLEACAKGGGADPVKVLIDTDEYPQVVKQIEQVEFIVGWFNGVAEAQGVLPEVLWDAIAPAPAPKTVKVEPAGPPPRPRTREPRAAPALAKRPAASGAGGGEVRAGAQAMLRELRAKRRSRPT